jgi:peptidyl-prolyl cis-trans isomerase SurA
MLRKKNIKTIVLIFILIIFKNISHAKIFVVAKIENEIITNHDVTNEINYLKLFNPNLSRLNEEEKFAIGKDSLINEIIKKKELNKLIDTENINPFLEKYLNDLYTKLNVSSEEEFKSLIGKKQNYKFDEIKIKLNIELLWNELIYSKFKNQLNIDESKIFEKIDNSFKKEQKKYNLSELVFLKDKNKELEKQIKMINSSIKEIGFANSATLYSIADSSKFGGQIGWIDENVLPEELLNKIKELKIGEHSEVFKVTNSFLILRINDIKIEKTEIDRDKEFKKLLQIETNNQLNKFSRIFFDKAKINYIIDEKK